MYPNAVDQVPARASANSVVSICEVFEHLTEGVHEMTRRYPRAASLIALIMILAERVSAEEERPGQEEFGLTMKELVQSVERTEMLIAECMREQGFRYIAVDFATIRKGMNAIMSMPGMGEEEFIEKHGFGIATLYTGKPPQLIEGYSPGKVGLGEQNIAIFKNLSPEDQVAYNHALFGKNTHATLAVAIDTEDFSQCGGCTREAVAQVFEPEQLKVTYYNPKDRLIDQDPRMKAALRVYAQEMNKAGFDYSHPEEVETDIRERLNAITQGETSPLEKMSPEQRKALKELQDYERKVSVVNLRLEEEILDEVDDQIEDELFGRGAR
jgi:hypothetical protein